MSAIVKEAQEWLNATYAGKPGFIQAPDTGLPGTRTSESLVSAMQIELGMSSVTGFFGDLTSQKCDEAPLAIGSKGNRVKLLQYGLYCKGYDPHASDGVFTEDTQNALLQIQRDAGMEGGLLSTSAKGLQCKAVLGVDEYKLLSGGDSRIRAIQQQLNRSYLQYTGLSPCDGIYSRGTNAALIYAIQAEEGLPVDVSTGTFGPTTTSCCPDIPYMGGQRDYNGNAYSDRSISSFILLFQYSLYCNGYDPGEFNGVVDEQTKQAMHTFQQEHILEVRDNIGINEWMGLLVSTGNPNRKVSGCDCASRITPEIAKKLKEANYYVVGRYLTGDVVSSSGRVSKNLLRPEMKTIFDAGLRLFVIYQDARQYYIENPSEENIYHYFNEEQGYADAEKAFSVAKSLGVPRNEIIYFAVDYDFMAGEVESKIKPYFEAINRYAREAGNPFRIGIYGARNTCTIIRNAGYSVSSFVSDMSTGYSGNLGFPLPEDWAFDQIKEMDKNESGFGIALDNDVVSGRYYGFHSFEKEHDDEWDLISGNGTAMCLTYGPDSEVPVYWAKIKNPDGSYSAKYPMYSGLKAFQFYSERRHNRPLSDVDGIYYIYFLDSNGMLNAGYIDIKDRIEFNAWRFTDVRVYRKRETNYSSIDIVPIPEEIKEPVRFIATKPLYVYIQRYGDDFVTKSLVSSGTTVYVEKNSETGASYPTAIRAIEYEKDDERISFIDPSLGMAYLDLGFEYGVSPDDRSLITDYNIM